MLPLLLTYFDWFNDLMIRLSLTLFDMLSDLFIALFDLIMLVVIPLITGLLDSLDFINLTGYIDLLPAEAKNFMQLIGFGQAFSIIISALIIKLLLQLIPFVRLGSK